MDQSEEEKLKTRRFPHQSQSLSQRVQLAVEAWALLPQLQVLQTDKSAVGLVKFM